MLVACRARGVRDWRLKLCWQKLCMGIRCASAHYRCVPWYANCALLVTNEGACQVAWLIRVTS